MLEKLTQIRGFVQSRNLLFSARDLEYLSASALYTKDLPPLGPGGFGLVGGDSYGAGCDKDIPLYGSAINLTNLPTITPPIKIPQFGTPSRIFIPESDKPLLRFDPADAIHPQGHLHVGSGTALPNLSTQEGINIYIQGWFANRKKEED